MTGAVRRLNEAVRGLAAADQAVPVSRADAWELTRLVEVLCPEEESCELCSNRVCSSCGIGEAHPCPSRFVVCVDCRGTCCHECRNDLREDA